MTPNNQTMWKTRSDLDWKEVEGKELDSTQYKQSQNGCAKE